MCHVGSFSLYSSDAFNQFNNASSWGKPKLHWKYFNGPKTKLLQNSAEKISEYLVLLLFGIKQFL